MNYSSRFYLYAPFALLLLVGAGFGMYWWSAAGALEHRLDAMETQEAMPGVTVHYTARSVRGFPFNLDVIFSDFRVTVETGHGPAVWRAENFALHALTYGRDETIFEAAGRQSLSWTDAKGRAHRLPFAAGSLHASAIRDTAGLSRFDLDIVDFGSPALVAARIQLHFRHAQDRFDVAASADEVHLSPVLHSAFGDTIRAMSLQGRISPAAPFDTLRAGRADWRSSVEAWRSAPGMVHLEPLAIHWGPLDMTGLGSLSLDDARRPEGIVDFKVTGTSAWLAQNPVMRPDGIAAGLRERAARAGSDAGGRMGAVLGIKDSVVYLGDDPVGMAEPLY
jgi:hypothetical protein